MPNKGVSGASGPRVAAFRFLHPTPVSMKNPPLLTEILLGASLVLSGVPLGYAAAPSPDVVDIGGRRELFVDDVLVERISGKAELRLHHPVPQNIAILHDAPWEGTGSIYHSIFKDGDLYRMYYKGYQNNPQREADPNASELHPPYYCYAESDDGIHWRKPELGLHPFNGSKANNIVMVSGVRDGVNTDGHPAIFKDSNPQATPDARYKALLRSPEPIGLVAFKSPDGLNWSPMQADPVITDGAFDSQNLAFWDDVRGEYRAYWRFFSRGTAANLHVGVRSIRTATSKDFIHWSNRADLKYFDSLPEQLYTNQIKPYYRAPHILIGFPMRYVERELPDGSLEDDTRAPAGPDKTRQWSPSMRALPELAHRETRAAASERYGSALTEGILMASRDGVTFKRWNEAFLRPGIERVGTWNYGHQFIGWQLVETKAALEGAPNELSIYATESYWTGNSSALRRYTIRLEGFVSVSAPMAGGEILTKPIRFEGKKLVLNFSTSAAGSINVEIQKIDGEPIPGYSFHDSHLIYGDSIDRTVYWKAGSDLEKLSGQAVRMRFILKDADLFAFQFQD